MGEAGDGAEATRKAMETKPDVVVLDLSMPMLSGLEATRSIREALPQTRILVLTMHDEDEYIVGSVRAGVSGYLLKDEAPSDLLAGIRALKERKVTTSRPRPFRPWRASASPGRRIPGARRGGSRSGLGSPAKMRGIPYSRPLRPRAKIVPGIGRISVDGRRPLLPLLGRRGVPGLYGRSPGAFSARPQRAAGRETEPEGFAVNSRADSGRLDALHGRDERRP